MKTILKTTVLLFLTSAAARAVAADVRTYFSPHGGVAAAIAHEIDEAKETVHVMTYSIAESQICNALVAAHKRGLDVRIIVNRSQQSPVQSRAPKLHAAGITLKTDHKHKLFHHKVVICDNRLVCTGSANHSRAADRDNVENMVIILDDDVAQLFTDNFNLHWENSRPFKPKPNRLRKRSIPDRSPLSPAKSPRKKGELSWLLLQDRYTPTTRQAVLQTPWSTQNGRGGITSAS